ncbi:unnamed protein product [Symbiodinium sp. CCMP2456]|nr:unnamed protein product [Symbiodinium sp. CCMP2456]
MQLGDHLKDGEQEESPAAIPPLHRCQSREWRSQDLPLTPPPPPASWMHHDCHGDSVSLEVRSSSAARSNGSESPEPLMPGVGAEAFLRANGQEPDNIANATASKLAIQDEEPPQENDTTDMADDQDEANKADDQEKAEEANEPEQTQDDQRTKHYSPGPEEPQEEVEEPNSPDLEEPQEEQASEQEEEAEDEASTHDESELPLVLHAQQRDPPADDPQEEEEGKEDKDDEQATKRPKKGVCLVSPEQKKHLKSLIRHGSKYRVEVYWTCQQPKVGVRCKATGKSMFCYTHPSFTILIELCNDMVVFFEKGGPDQKWEQVNYKANSVLMSLRSKYRAELKAGLA